MERSSGTDVFDVACSLGIVKRRVAAGLCTGARAAM